MYRVSETLKLYKATLCSFHTKNLQPCGGVLVLVRSGSDGICGQQNKLSLHAKFISDN